MSRRLPPLNSLRAFEAAARHQSFKRAAEELHVTPAAVSQQIRALEEAAGTELFRRLPRALALTDAGRAAAPLMTEGFDKLAEGAEAMRDTGASRVLTVSTGPTFGAKWLLPRLERFRVQHPDIDVRLDATDTLADLAEDGVDIGLRYGRGSYLGLVSELLLQESTIPVCAPALLQAGPPLATPDDLRRHTLLHSQWRFERDSAPNWRMWLKAAGVDPAFAERGPRFSADTMIVQAAIQGQGVGLVGRVVVADDLAAGRLVEPFPHLAAETAGFAYYMVCRPDRLCEPKIAAFRAWLVAEAVCAGAEPPPLAGPL
ncbi:MAG: transcriptional regulator GcvA [Pikeienuella sp.]